MTLTHHLPLPPLSDGVINLVPPTLDLASNFAAHTRHDVVQREFPAYANMTVGELTEWIGKINGGLHFNSEPRCPIYWFWILAGNDVIGDLELRITQHPSALLATGHVGYHVLPQ